jgi:uncharacterized membrane protein YoaK (UPF0700 family)
MNSLGEAPKEWLSFSLAFVGGFGDAAGFVLAKTFTGHITGNLVLAAVSLTAADWRTTAARLLAVVFFLAGILLSVFLVRLPATRLLPSLLTAAFAAELILIISSSIALMSHATMGIEIFVLCLSLALGLQNGAFRRAGGISVHTTYLTGMITGLMVTEAENFFSTARTPAAPNLKVGLLYGIWVCFFLGAAAGATLVFHFKEVGMLGLALILLILTVRNSISAQPARLAGRGARA